MNVYFLVEGRTEAAVYPQWLDHLVPRLRRVKFYDRATTNNYYLFSARGYPAVVQRDLPHAVQDVNECGLYDFLVVCLDADEEAPATRARRTRRFLEDEGVELNAGTELVVLVQNRCIETWFLGNRDFYPRHPHSSRLRRLLEFYDASIDDPEAMGRHGAFNHAQFHTAYFSALFDEYTNFEDRYMKASPKYVTRESYLEQLLARIEENPDHLPTFQAFVALCARLNERLDASPNESRDTL